MMRQTRSPITSFLLFNFQLELCNQIPETREKYNEYLQVVVWKKEHIKDKRKNSQN